MRLFMLANEVFLVGLVKTMRLSDGDVQRTFC